MTDSSGGAAKRFDYLPFGGDLLSTIDGRTTGVGYYSSPSGVNPEFTGKSRDAETALDWFQIRHMSANQGRFQSPDPDNTGADPADPQTWNAYSYVGNNPLSLYGSIG
jgi:RHS repeat-associated protein